MPLRRDPTRTAHAAPAVGRGLPDARRRLTGTRWRVAPVAVVVLLAAVASIAGNGRSATAATAATPSYVPPGAPQPQPPSQCGTADPTWFQPNCAYGGYFADPSVIRVDNDPNLGGKTTYYAFGTSTGGSMLPVMWSTDPLNGPWVPRPAYPAPTPNGDGYFNDGLGAPYVRGGNQPPPWVRNNGSNGAWQQKTLWAPGPVHLTTGHYATFFAAEDRVDHWCIGRATAANPWGPYTADAAPMICAAPDGSPRGVLDPQPFQAPDGNLYLIYKSEGIPGSGPTKIYSRQLQPDATATAGAPDRFLLQTDATWQLMDPSTGSGDVENPAMTYVGGTYYLFYSGNDWTTAQYGSGYATCSGPAGPCSDRTTAAPLIRSGSDARGQYWGAGAATPFTDPAGNLYVAFQAWDRAGGLGAGGRRLFHTSRLYRQPDGALSFADPTPNIRYVAAAYHDFVGRAPTSSESAFWTTALGSGTSRYTFVDSLANSREWVGHIVTNLYLDTLGRSPDAGGLQTWTDWIIDGRFTVAEVAARFYSSDEYFAGFGHSDVRTWVTDLYRKILLRSPDAGGLDLWTRVANTQGRTAVTYPFFQSPESAQTRVTHLYESLLGRGPDPGGLAYWSGVVVRDGDVSLAATLATSTEYFLQAQSR